MRLFFGYEDTKCHSRLYVELAEVVLGELGVHGGRRLVDRKVSFYCVLVLVGGCAPNFINKYLPRVSGRGTHFKDIAFM